ncbi:MULTISPECIES: hypothetical protein [Herbaspirillum]|uniref:Uncharacterized protein n=2 Tax=Herbaspirillum huttiense TaxID=863372 RepID=A0AAJ2LVE3_9BURK|nr:MULTISPECIES: hypothetical protein [Herbaspirillum]MDR9836926.1 hypothetical protein [Herbaspirillum huttiense]
MKLTDAQKRVMKWLGNGWPSEPGPGASIHVNGSRICNVDTLNALERLGLVEQRAVDGKKLLGEWQATQAGKNLTEDQQL